MSRKYYLEDNIEYLPDTGELVVDGHIENLQSLENKLLLHFIAHPNELITKDELYKVGWNDRIYGDNPLSKVISNLRAKLKDNPKAPRYIKTVPKKGFVFVSQVSAEPTLVPMIVPVERDEGSSTPILPVLLMTAVVMLLTAMWLSGDWLLRLINQQPSLRLSSIQALSNSAGQKNEPNISADGKLVVYTLTKSVGDFSQVVLRVIDQNIEKIITTEDHHSLSPKLHQDGRRILYHRKTQNSCSIAIITLSPQFDVLSDRVLTQCGLYSQNLGLTWGPDSTIYYSDNDQEFGAYNIYQLDINSGQRKLIATPESTKGRGYYNIHYDPVANVLQTLYNDYWYDTHVTTMNLQGEVLNSHLVNYPLFAISSFGGHPVFKTKANHVHYLQNGIEHRLMDSPLKPLYAPSFSDGENKSMVFVGGDFYNMDLVLIDLVSQTEVVLVTSDAIQKLPVLTQSKNLYFISNHNGVYQVFKYSDDDTTQQLSQFDNNHRIQGLAVSDDEQYIAVSIDKDIHLYRLTDKPLLLDSSYLTFKDSINPHFSPDGKALWITRTNQNIYNMSAIDIASKKQIGSSIKNGYIGIFDQQTGEHYIFKDIQPGVWTLQNNQLVLLNDKPLVTSNHSASINNGVLRYYANKEAQILQLDLNNKPSNNPSNNQSTIIKKSPYRYFAPLKGQPDQLVVVRSRFGDTNIYLASY